MFEVVDVYGDCEYVIYFVIGIMQWCGGDVCLVCVFVVMDELEFQVWDYCFFLQGVGDGEIVGFDV